MSSIRSSALCCYLPHISLLGSNSRPIQTYSFLSSSTRTFTCCTLSISILLFIIPSFCSTPRLQSLSIKRLPHNLLLYILIHLTRFRATRTTIRPKENSTRFDSLLLIHKLNGPRLFYNLFLSFKTITRDICTHAPPHPLQITTKHVILINYYHH